MPRRVRRPQAAKEVRSFSPAACTSEKIPPSPPVCGSPAPGGRSVRAADCEPFAGKPNGLFGSAPLRETSAAQFVRSCLAEFAARRRTIRASSGLRSDCRKSLKGFSGSKKQAALLRPVRKICNYSAFGPAATRALPASLPSYLTKFLTKREARSFAFSSHWEASA